MATKLNRNVIEWATRRSAISDGQMQKAFPKLDEWLEGTREPTLNQLKKLAKKLNIRLYELFSDSLPSYALQIPDYRTASDSGVTDPSPNLYDTVELMVRRQSWMRDYFLDEGYDRVDLVGSYRRTDDGGAEPRELAARLHAWLEMADDWALCLRTYDEAFRLLKDSVELHGVSVAVNGVVGDSTNRPLDVDEFRGFALADDYAPLIFINGRDTKGAQIFTLIHELAHLALNQTGVSNPLEGEVGATDIERFCNAVAANYLIPQSQLFREWGEERASLYVKVEGMARAHKVSFMVVARRAHDESLLSDEDFLAICKRHKREASSVERRQGSGGDFYRTKHSRLGAVFSDAVLGAVASGQLAYRDAYELTNMKGSTFSKYFEGVV